MGLNISNFKLKPYEEKYAEKAFYKLLGPDTESWQVYKDYHINKKLSKTLYYKNKRVGIYILGKIDDLEEYFSAYNNETYTTPKGHVITYKIKFRKNLKKYFNKKGIHGIALYIEPKYRGYGAGKMLIEYAKSKGDYTLGGHDVKLDNLKHWLKIRFLAANIYTVKKGKKKLDSYYTISPINSNN